MSVLEFSLRVRVADDGTVEGHLVTEDSRPQLHGCFSIVRKELATPRALGDLLASVLVELDAVRSRLPIERFELDGDGMLPVPDSDNYCVGTSIDTPAGRRVVSMVDRDRGRLMLMAPGAI